MSRRVIVIALVVIACGDPDAHDEHDTVTVSASASGGEPTLTATSTSAGASCSGATCTIDISGDVTLTSSDLAPGHRFAGWTGDGGCASAALGVTLTAVTSNTTCIATWIGRVTVTGSPSPPVIASSADPNASCAGGACTVDAGQSVMLEAPVVSGKRFVTWNVECGSTLPVIMIAPAHDLTCTAQYANQITVTAAATGGAPELTAMSTSAGASCAGASCTLDQGGDVTLTSSDLAPGHRFAGWSGDAGCTSAQLSFAVTGVGTTTTCTAAWVQRFTVAGVAPSGTVIASSTDPNKSCTTSACTVDTGQSVTLVAPAIAGSVFIGWSSASCGTTETTLVTPAQDLTCTAQYAPAFTVSGTASPATAGSVVATAGAGTCSANTCSVPTGTTVTLVASANTGYDFAKWSANCGGGTAATAMVTVAGADIACTATYRVRVTGAVAGNGTATITGAPVGDAGASCTTDASPVCSSLPGTIINFTVTPAAGTRVLSWTGCTGAGNHAVAAVGTTPTTCTANIVIEWAVSLGDPSGVSVITDTATSITMPDALTINILGNATGTGYSRIWLHTLDSASGNVETSLVLNKSANDLPTNSARRHLQIGTDSVILFATATWPAIARITSASVITFERMLVGEIPIGSTLANNVPSSLVASADGLLRIGSTLTHSSAHVGRLTAASSTTGAPQSDFTVCDTQIGATCGATCIANTDLAAMADSTNATVVALRSSFASNSFVVASITYAGAVQWAKRVTFGGTALAPSTATSLPGGRVAIVGANIEAGSNIDAFYIVFEPDGSQVATLGAYGSSFGRATGTEFATSVVPGPNASSALLAIGGGFTDTSAAPDQDAWLVVVDGAGGLASQTAYGGMGSDVANAIAVTPTGYVLAGSTASFGLPSTEMWVLRTDTPASFLFSAASGHVRTTAAALRSLPTVTATSCVTTAAATPDIGDPKLLKAVGNPDFVRQAP